MVDGDKNRDRRQGVWEMATIRKPTMGLEVETKMRQGRPGKYSKRITANTPHQSLAPCDPFLKLGLILFARVPAEPPPCQRTPPPCQNGGVCVDDVATDSFRCRCSNPYFGETCQGECPVGGGGSKSTRKSRNFVDEHNTKEHPWGNTWTNTPPRSQLGAVRQIQESAGKFRDAVEPRVRDLPEELQGPIFSDSESSCLWMKQELQGCLDND